MMRMSEERKKVLYFVIKAVAFMGIFLVLFTGVSKVFLAKSENVYGYINYRMQEKDSIDVLILGSSHSADGIHARDMDAILAEEYGLQLKSFNMSVTGMRLEQMNFRLKEAVKTQMPKLLVIETFSCAPQSTGTEENLNRWSLDYLPVSKNKMEYIDKHIEEEMKTSFLVPFIKYHSRWKELNAADWEILLPADVLEKSKNCGFTAPDKPDYSGVVDDYFEQDFSNIVEIKELPVNYQEEMAELLALCEEIDCKVLFLSVPYKVQADFYNTELVKYNNYLEKEYVDNENVYIYDMNKETISLGWGYEHMTDEGHVNNQGRSVINRELAKQISLMMEER